MVICWGNIQEKFKVFTVYLIFFYCVFIIQYISWWNINRSSRFMMIITATIAWPFLAFICIKEQFLFLLFTKLFILHFCNNFPEYSIKTLPKIPDTRLKRAILIYNSHQGSISYINLLLVVAFRGETVFFFETWDQVLLCDLDLLNR